MGRRRRWEAEGGEVVGSEVGVAGGGAAARQRRGWSVDVEREEEDRERERLKVQRRNKRLEEERTHCCFKE